MEQVTDRLETLIIMAMDARHGDFGLRPSDADDQRKEPMNWLMRVKY